MNRIPTLFATAAAAGLLAAPASAVAAGSTVIAGPIKVKGYDLTLSATDNGAADSFSIAAVRRSGQSSQMHSWSFSSGVAVAIKGAKATIKGSLGAFGSIDAKVATGAKTTGRPPAGCTGTTGSTRKGTLSGKARLALDHTFFKTVAPKAMRAMIVQGGKLQCGGTPGASQSGLTLMSTVDGDGGQTMFTITKVGGTVFQQVMQSSTAGSTSVLHLITAQTGASGLDAAGDLSTATAPAAGPFLSGTLRFAGDAMGSMATGTTSGDFAAKFDSIGTQAIPDGNDAMLMQR